MKFETFLDSNKCKIFIVVGFIFEVLAVIGCGIVLLKTEPSNFSTNQNIAIYVVSICIVFSAMILLGIIRQSAYTKAKACFALMNIVLCFALTTDFFAWILYGHPEYRLLCSIINSIDLIAVTIHCSLFWLFIKFSYDAENKIVKKYEIVLIKIFASLGCAFPIADLFIGFGYYVDESGKLQANDGVMLLCIWILAISILLLILMFKVKVKKNERVILLSYILIPVLYFLIFGERDLLLMNPVIFASYLFNFCNLVVQRERENIKNEAILNNTKKELEVARQIQTGILPVNFEEYDSYGVDIYGYMNAAKEVGGDFYDFFMVDDDKIAFVIADVSGKGIPAAMFMMRTKSIIKNNVKSGATPGTVLTKTNEILSADNKEKMFVTAWLGIADLKKRKITVC